jgi:hypothetical protein
MNCKVIDNFLEEEYFNSLVALLEEIPWYYLSTVAASLITENNIFYLYHMFYVNNAPCSPIYDKLLPVVRKLGGESLIRIKGNLYPNTETLHEHPMHTDFSFSHSTALLSLNTCNGYTKLEDGTKIDSVANRVLLFDAKEKHCSTTTTNVSARYNINVNYIQEEWTENWHLNKRLFK